MAQRDRIEERLRGILLGTAVGDALGPDSVAGFGRSLAWKMRFWLLGLPAGIGLATLRSILKLWCGASPANSGVASAGNGPAMRSAIIGACFAADPGKMNDYVEASTRLTHTDPRALTGAKAVAALAAWSMHRDATTPPEVEQISALLQQVGQADDREWRTILEKFRSACEERLSVEEFAGRLDLHHGVSGYIYHTVPVAIYAWLRHYGDFQETLESVLECGGDTDTVGAIAGALAGAVVGERGIPAEWITGIWDWPRGLWVLRRLGNSLAQQCNGAGAIGPVRYFWPGVIPRNVFFLGVVLAHGFRRLAPPY